MKPQRHLTVKCVMKVSYRQIQLLERKPYQGSISCDSFTSESRVRPISSRPIYSQESHSFPIWSVKMEEKIHVCADCHVIFDTEDSLTNHYQTCKEMKPVVKREIVRNQEYDLEDSVIQHNEENMELVTDQKTKNLPDDDQQSVESSFLEDLFLVKGNHS